MQYFKLGRLKTKRTKALQVNWRHAMLFCYVMLLNFLGDFYHKLHSQYLSIWMFSNLHPLRPWKKSSLRSSQSFGGTQNRFFKNPISFMVSWLSTNGNDWPIQICDILTFPSYLYLGEISHYVVTRKYYNNYNSLLFIVIIIRYILLYIYIYTLQTNMHIHIDST